MGQKDLTEKNLQYYPDVFADILNALLYDGKPMIAAEELQPAPTETLYYSQKGGLRNQFHDVSKFVSRHGSILAQYTLENETKASRKMIFRRLGYEGAVYREQLDRKTDYPFIGLVLYWGRKRWTQPRSIAEYFSSRDIPLETWKYINNFRLQVFQMSRLPKEVRQRFTSDMRIVVDFLAEGKDYKPTTQRIVHVEAFLLLMKNLTNDDRYEALVDKLIEEEKKGAEINMCEWLDKYINQGIQQGIEQGIQQGISQGESRMLVKTIETLMANMAFSLKQACESVGSTVEEYQKAKLM